MKWYCILFFLCISGTACTKKTSPYIQDDAGFHHADAGIDDTVIFIHNNHDDDRDTVILSDNDTETSTTAIDDSNSTENCADTVCPASYYCSDDNTCKKFSEYLSEIRGFYAVIPWEEIPNPDIWTQKFVKGIVIRTYWKNLETEKGVYTWKYLDDIFEQAKKSQKKIHLIVTPGFYSPQYVLNDTMVKKQAFTVPQGPYKNQVHELPLPWDETYLQYWFDFVTRLSERYAQHPSLAYISATGPNSHNGETALPREKEDQEKWMQLVTGTSNQEKQQALFQVLQTAWRKTIDQFCSNFSQKHFTVALIHQPFPVDGNPELQDQFQDQMIEYAKEKCPYSFGVQTNGLDGRPIYPDASEPQNHWHFVKDLSPTTLAGFQTEAPANLYPPKSNTTIDKNSVTRQVILNALGSHAHFSEWYDSDILDPAFKPLFELYHPFLSGSITQKELIEDYHGIFAIKEDKPDETITFDEQVFLNQHISGLSYRIEWKDIQPQQSTFQWTKLDTIFEKALLNKKKVKLIIVPGFGTPDWVLAESQTERFIRKYGNEAGTLEKLPLPWDDTYLNRWYEFLQALSQRYANHSQFIAIALAGPTSVSAEMSLPNGDSDMKKWKDFKYKPSLYINAWKEVLLKYREIFPKQYHSLALYPGLAINEQGQTDNSERKNTRTKVIDTAIENDSLNISLQTSGLHAGVEDDNGEGYDIVRSYNNIITTGFQMSTSATRKPAKMGDAQCSARALKLSIDKGIAPNVSKNSIVYLEIYEPDILNSQMQTILEYGSQALLGNNTQDPTLSCN